MGSEMRDPLDRFELNLKRIVEAGKILAESSLFTEAMKWRMKRYAFLTASTRLTAFDYQTLMKKPSTKSKRH